MNLAEWSIRKSLITWVMPLSAHLIQVAKDNLKIQECTLEIAKVLFTGGLINELDYLQAETLLNNTRSTISPLEAQCQQAKNALNVLPGKAPNTIDHYLTETKPIPATPL